MRASVHGAYGDRQIGVPARTKVEALLHCCTVKKRLTFTMSATRGAQAAESLTRIFHQ